MGTVRNTALALALVIAAAAAAPAHAAKPRSGATSSGPTTVLPVLSQAQRRYLALAEQGVAEARRWGDERRGWYDARLSDRERYPLATIWDIVPLFESLDAIAIVAPSPANLHALAHFAAGA